MRSLLRRRVLAPGEGLSAVGRRWSGRGPTTDSRRPTAGAARRWRGVLILALLTLSACAPGRGPLPRPSPEQLPPGSPLHSRTLEDGDAWLRHHLMYGDHPAALEMLADERAAPSDRLLRWLQQGLVLHRAGAHARSNEVLERAEVEAELRYTRSVSRALASLASSDRVMAYTPTAAELAMIPFYRMLNYLALGDRAGALVESRKANALLARLEVDAEARCREHALIQHLAGLVQAAAGERNDALVSLRQAERGYDGCGGAEVSAPASLGADLRRAALALGLRETADSAAARYGLSLEGAPAGGEVVVLLEHGFITHRAQEALHVPIYPEDVEGVEGGDEPGVLEATGRVTARLTQNLLERSAWGASVDDHPVAQWGSALEGAYVLRLAWPVARREAAGPAGVRVVAADDSAAATLVGDLSSVAERELRQRHPAILSRMVARGLAKYLLAREVERKAEKQGGELAAFVAGRLTNLAANELERADTRSWSLLPDGVSLARLRLPAGEHRLRIETLDADGAVLETRELPPVRVADGEVVLLGERVWSAGAVWPGHSAHAAREAGQRP